MSSLRRQRKQKGKGLAKRYQDNVFQVKGTCSDKALDGSTFVVSDGKEGGHVAGMETQEGNSNRCLRLGR